MRRVFFVLGEQGRSGAVSLARPVDNSLHLGRRPGPAFPGQVFLLIQMVRDFGQCAAPVSHRDGTCDDCGSRIELSRVRLEIVIGAGPASWPRDIGSGRTVLDLCSGCQGELADWLETRKAGRGMDTITGESESVHPSLVQARP